MSEPKSIDEYNKRFKMGELIDGYGLDTTMHMPCPFCAEAGWISFKIIETEKKMARGATCKACGRSARAAFSKNRSGVGFELVQTGGPDQPKWMQPKMRRVDE